MSENEVPREQDSAFTAEEIKDVNDRNREVPTRPGWRAALGVIAFIGGFVVYVTNV